jgi:MFS family permease
MSEAAAGVEQDAASRVDSQGTASKLAGYGREFWLVFWASFAVNSVGNLFVFFPIFVVRLGGGAAAIGAIASLGSAAALVLRPRVSALIDSHGRRLTALWAIALEAIAVLLYIPLKSLGWPIYAVRLLHGAADGTARVSLFAMVYEILPPGRRAEGMMLFSLCGMAPAALAPMLGETLVKYIGFAAFFCGASAMCGVAAWATGALTDDRPRGGAPVAHIRKARVGYRALLYHSRLLPLWIVTLAFSIAVAPRVNFVAPFADQRGIAQVGWYFALYSGVAIIMRLFGTQLMERVGLERSVAPSLGLLAVGIGLLALTGHTGALFAAALLGGLGHSFVYPAISALIITHTPPAATGYSSSIYTSLFDFVTMIAPYGLGVIATLWGYAPMFVIAGVVAALGALYFAAIEPGRFASPS